MQHWMYLLSTLLSFAFAPDPYMYEKDVAFKLSWIVLGILLVCLFGLFQFHTSLLSYLCRDIAVRVILASYVSMMLTGHASLDLSHA